MVDYDYIVVGAGSAGCAVAARLSGHSAASVLLLEAGGPDDDPNIHIPAMFPSLFKTAADWAYETEPQEHLNGRRDYMPRGKVLGGSSSLNAMVYQRGNAADYDGWAKLGRSRGLVWGLGRSSRRRGVAILQLLADIRVCVRRIRCRSGSGPRLPGRLTPGSARPFRTSATSVLHLCCTCFRRRIRIPSRHRIRR